MPLRSRSTTVRQSSSLDCRSQLYHPSAANIRIEVLCDDHLASAITEELQARYYERYGMVIFIADVLVLHPGKF